MLVCAILISEQLIQLCSRLWAALHSSPADIRASLNAIAIDTLNRKKKGSQSSSAKGRTGKQQKSGTSKSGKPRKQEKINEEQNPTYHFIGYVPAFGKVWELDGLKSGPLEVGELASQTGRDGWMDVVRPALRLKMAKYGGSGLEDSDIRFSLLAVVQDAQFKITDELEFLKKDRDNLESQMEPGWEQEVIPVLFDDDIRHLTKVRLIQPCIKNPGQSLSIPFLMPMNIFQVLPADGCNATSSSWKCLETYLS